ncbi:MAG: hypothetical protein FJZ98_01495 [Chloroflexi bacterium]|nr:hypothetical protein [Chloroflexota bacterium]
MTSQKVSLREMRSISKQSAAIVLIYREVDLILGIPFIQSNRIVILLKEHPAFFALFESSERSECEAYPQGSAKPTFRYWEPYPLG